MLMIRIQRIDVEIHSGIELCNKIDFASWSTDQDINTFDLTLL